MFVLSLGQWLWLKTKHTDLNKYNPGFLTKVVFLIVLLPCVVWTNPQPALCRSQWWTATVFACLRQWVRVPPTRSPWLFENPCWSRHRIQSTLPIRQSCNPAKKIFAIRGLMHRNSRSSNLRLNMQQHKNTVQKDSINNRIRHSRLNVSRQGHSSEDTLSSNTVT